MARYDFSFVVTDVGLSMGECAGIGWALAPAAARKRMPAAVPVTVPIAVPVTAPAPAPDGEPAAAGETLPETLADPRTRAAALG